MHHYASVGRPERPLKFGRTRVEGIGVQTSSIGAPVAGTRSGLLSRIRRLTLAEAATTVAFAIVVRLMLQPAKDPDLFWHLATGRWITKHHRVPKADPFSWTTPGRRWIAHEWLTETWFWGLHRIGGFPLLSIAATLIVVTAMALTWRTMRRLGTPLAVAAAFVVLGAFAALPTWGIRPQMLSFALLAFVVALTTDAWQTGHARMLWTLPPTLLVWANLHGGYIFGIAVLGAFTVGTTIEQYRAKPRNTELIRTAWLVTVASIAATLLNPNGVAGFTYPFTYLGANASTRYVAEWKAPQFSKPDFWALGLLLVVGVIVLVRGRRRVPIHAWIQIVALSALALQSIRNSSPFVAVVLPWIAATASGPNARKAKAAPNGASTVHMCVALAGLATALTGTSAVSAANQQRSHQANFPVAAVEWMNANPHDHVMNRYEWGGYAILHASTKVGVDGRPDMYGDRFIDRYLSTWMTTTGWRDRLRTDDFRRVIGMPTDPIVRALTATPNGWRIVYNDGHAVVIDRQ